MMCGIAAMLLYPQVRSEAQWTEIRANFTQNLLFNEQRGMDATGVALLQQNGQLLMEKRPLPAAEFCQTEAYHALCTQIGSQTSLILGHTRRPTKGTTLNNKNNHPIEIGNIAGIHNGHIDNDDILFQQCNCQRQAQVDSEIIFQILNQRIPKALDMDEITAVQSALSTLQGKYTFLACDKRSPSKLLVAKYRNPLSVHYHPEWNALVFSSRYIFLRKTFGADVRYETIENNQVMIFDATALHHTKHYPLVQTPLQAV
jgi:glucosamine 6-phosphate synthetase-like amidotransferase/phosphosugar isomerase protein